MTQNFDADLKKNWNSFFLLVYINIGPK